jgi:hypothetical protein
MSIILGIEMVIALGLTLDIVLGLTLDIALGLDIVIVLAIVIVASKTRPPDGKCPTMESAPRWKVPHMGICPTMESPPWELIGIYTPLAKIKVAATCGTIALP